MGYFIDPEGNYPRHAGDVQLVVPGWNEEADDLPDGWINVEPGEPPLPAEDEILVELEPAIVNGVYVRQFELQPRPIEEN